MVDENSALIAVVATVTVATVVRCAHAVRYGRPVVTFLSACVLAQMVGLYGLVCRVNPCIEISHVGFTVLIWIGAFTTKGVDRMLVQSLALFAWMSRRVLGHCMFARARGSTATDDARYDLLYAVPFFICYHRPESDKSLNFFEKQHV